MTEKSPMQLIGMGDLPDICGVAAAIPLRGSRFAAKPRSWIANIQAFRASSPLAKVATWVRGKRTLLTDARRDRHAALRGPAGVSAPLPTDRIGPGTPAPDAECIPLRDGRRVTIQPLGANAAMRFQQFIHDLSPTARAMRFHAGFAEAPPSLLQFLTAADQHQHVAWVAQECAHEGPIVAEARYVAIDGEAELALAVADAWRRQGLGRTLLSQLVRRAKASGIRRVWGYVRRDNEPMLRLATNTGFELKALADDRSVVIAERRLETGADLDPPAGRGWLAPPRRSRAPAPAPSLAIRAMRWIRAYGLPALAAIVLPGGFLVAAVAGLARLRRRRTARRGDDAASSRSACLSAPHTTSCNVHLNAAPSPCSIPDAQHPRTIAVPT